MQTEGIGHLKIFQGIYRESNQDPIALWCSGNREVLDKKFLRVPLVQHKSYKDCLRIDLPASADSLSYGHGRHLQLLQQCWVSFGMSP